MQIITKYSIGDKVKVRYLVEEFSPVTSAHIIEGVGIVDEIIITRSGINYRVFVENCYGRSYTEIIEIISHEKPNKISAEHFTHLNHYGKVSILDKKTRQEYDFFAFSDNDKISLGNNYSGDVIVSKKELESDYEYKVDFSNELNDKISLDCGEFWEVKENIFNETKIVMSNNIDRLCDLLDFTKIKKIEVSRNEKNDK